VVVEAAEDLGALGAPEAGPVLVCLLRHPSVHVRQTAGQALERVADAAVLASLLDGLDDPAVGVRFSLVGAVGRVAGAEGKATLSASQREAILARLQAVLHRDADPGVRSRAATVLGECGPPSVLPALWQRVAAVEDARVQGKAWAAFIDIIVRSGSLDLLREWDAELAKVKPNVRAGDDRRLRLLTEAHERWQKREDRRLFAATAELLARAQLDQGKWPAAVALLLDLLARGQPPEGPSRERALRLLLTAAQQARRYDLAAPRWIAEKAQPYLTERSKLAEEFQKVDAESQESAIRKSGGDR
jgi:HEAT repeat protein